MIKPIQYLIFIALIMLLGCSQYDDGKAFTPVEQAIRNGKDAPDSEYGAVVAFAVHTETMDYTYCSGVLIGEDLVLTAAHCVTNETDFPFTTLLKDGQIRIIASQNAISADNSRIFSISELSVHPDYAPQTQDHDIALVWLDRSVPQEIAEPLPYLLDESRVSYYAHQHENVEFVGFGLDTEQQDSLRLTVPGTIQEMCRIGSENCLIANSLGEKQLVAEGTLFHDIAEGGPCYGDSGGPVLLDVQGKKTVIGVTSFGDADCMIYSVSTVLASHSGWFESKTSDSGDESCSSTSRMPSGPIPVAIIAFILGCFGVIRKRSHQIKTK